MKGYMKRMLAAALSFAAVLGGCGHWKAGEKGFDPVINGLPSQYGTPAIEYKVKGADDNTYTTAKPTAAGEYTVRANFSATDNYNAFSATADFTIASKDGLSGGAVAGIVIGSAAPVGIAGFCLYWFLIRKKKADDNAT